jgi:hypothetical protein
MTSIVCLVSANDLQRVLSGDEQMLQARIVERKSE